MNRMVKAAIRIDYVFGRLSVGHGLGMEEVITKNEG